MLLIYYFSKISSWRSYPKVQSTRAARYYISFASCLWWTLRANPCHKCPYFSNYFWSFSWTHRSRTPVWLLTKKYTTVWPGLFSFLTKCLWTVNLTLRTYFCSSPLLLSSSANNYLFFVRSWKAWALCSTRISLKRLNYGDRHRL